MIEVYHVDDDGRKSESIGFFKDKTIKEVAYISKRGFFMGAREFIHPVSKEVISGEQILPGCVLRKTDVYPSTTGEWQLCSTPGIKIGRKCKIVWVRPSQPEGTTCVFEPGKKCVSTRRCQARWQCDL
jgi:hypothetical protein